MPTFLPGRSDPNFPPRGFVRVAPPRPPRPRCPRCQGSILQDEDGLVCIACGRRPPITPLAPLEYSGKTRRRGPSHGRVKI